MDDIESAFNDLLFKLEKKCPIFIPSILPQKISLNSLNDLLHINQNENSHEIEYFESLSSTIPFIVFCTSISYSSRFITITDVKVFLCHYILIIYYFILPIAFLAL